MDRRLKALILLPTAIVALASWSAIEQPIGQSAWTTQDAQQHPAVASDTSPQVAPSSDILTTPTAGAVILVGMALDAADIVDFGVVGAAVGAVAGGVAEVGGALGWFSAAFAGAVSSAAVVTMGVAG